MTMNTSVRSTALEPPRGTPWYRQLTTTYGLVVLTAILFVIFAILRPNTFATLLNFQLLASSQSILLILALAVTIPMIAGKIDLSIGYGAGLWQVMALNLQLLGVDYRLSGAGLPAPVTVRFAPLEAFPDSIESSIDMLVAKGCTPQLNRLVDSMSEEEQAAG